MRKSLLLILLAAALMGCPGFGSEVPMVTTDVPLNPSWDDVEPVLDLLCAECHTTPFTQSASTYVYDVCEDGDVPGAKSGAARILARLPSVLPTAPMPPPTYREKMSPDDELLLTRWVNQGATCGAATNNGVNNGVNNGTTGTNNGTTGGANNGAVPTFTVVADIVRGTCANPGGMCHQMGRAAFTVSSTATDAEVATALQVDGQNNLLPFIVANDSANSYLFTRISATIDTMPPEPVGMLPAEQIDIFRDWIDAGADFGQ